MGEITTRIYKKLHDETRINVRRTVAGALNSDHDWENTFTVQEALAKGLFSTDGGTIHPVITTVEGNQSVSLIKGIPAVQVDSKFERQYGSDKTIRKFAPGYWSPDDIQDPDEGMYP